MKPQLTGNYLILANSQRPPQLSPLAHHVASDSVVGLDGVKFHST